jgi:peptidoglycan/xylan/chitin deacetylase (PgdA/CDA1 family)
MKKLVLTFDDGPSPYYTSQLLDVLKEHHTKATFFVVVDNAIESPELINRMQKEGHCVALHSLEHRHAFLCGYHYMKKDFSKSLELMKHLNCNIHFYRPPWGVRNLFTRSFVRKHQLQMVLWDIMTGDWKAGTTPEMIAKQLENRAFDGAVICLHDGCEKYGGAKGAPQHTIDALKSVLPKLGEMGYEFITVEEFYHYA